jgi:hypothetical protein
MKAAKFVMMDRGIGLIDGQKFFKTRYMYEQ